jgi:hypothetical protein
MYVDDLRLYDVANVTMTMKSKTSGYIGYDDYDPELADIFMVYSTGNLTHEAPSIDKDACDLTEKFNTEYPRLTMIRNTSATFVLDQTTHFKARACAFSNSTNKTFASSDASSEVSSLSFNLGAGMPSIVPKDFGTSNDGGGGGDENIHPSGLSSTDARYDFTGLSKFNLALFDSGPIQTLQYYFLQKYEAGSAETAMYFHKDNTNACDGNRRPDCVYGTQVADAENICVKENTYVLALATEEGKWPSRVSVSEKYDIKLTVSKQRSRTRLRNPTNMPHWDVSRT